MTEILDRIARVRILQSRVERRSGFLVFGVFLLLVLVIATLLESMLRPDSTGRTLLFFLSSLILIALFLRHAAAPLLRLMGVLSAPGDFEIAGHIGTHFPTIKDRLLNLLQLHRDSSSGTSPYSPELIDASFQDLSDAISKVDFTTSVDASPVQRSLKLFALTGLGSLLLFLSSPGGFLDSYHRILHFNQEFTAPALYTFEVLPGNREVVKGETVEVRVHVSTTQTTDLSDLTLELLWRQEGQSNFEKTGLRSQTGGVFQSTFNSLRASTEYFVKVADLESERFKLTVLDRPVLRSLQVRLDFPEYTRLPPRIQDEFVGDVTALAGTRISLSGTASKDLARGEIVFGPNKTQPLNVRGDLFTANFTINEETDYSVSVRDEESLTNPDPIRYKIRIVPDDFPSVAILQPGRNLDIAGNQFLPLLIQAKDDFGISTLRLGYRLVHSRYEQPQETPRFLSIPIPSSRNGQVEIPYTWDLSPLSLVPEDVVEYFAEVFDNDVIHGPKSGRSQMFLLRLPSLEEVFAESEKGQDQSIDDLKQTLQDAKELKEKLKSIQQDIRTNKEMDWQQQKKLEEMAKQYQELQKKLEEVKNNVDQLVQKMDQQNILSQETLEKYMELQQLFEQLDSAELQQIMKQMQQAMQQVNREQLQQALQKMTFSEERFRESLERTLNLLKRIQIEQKLDEVKKRAESLEAQQKDLQEQTAQAQNDQGKLNELAKQQDDLARQEKLLEEAARELQKRMEEFFAEMPADKMQQLNEQVAGQKIDQAMQQASSMMQQGKPQQAGAMQQQAQQNLQQMSEQLQSMQQEMLQQQMQHVMNEMRRAINNLLELSKREETLKQQSQSAPPNSPQLRQNAQDQLRLMQDLGNVIQGLSELSKRSFAVTPEMGKAIGEAFQKMQSAMSSLDARNGFMASQEQGSAMGSLNKAAMEVQNSLQAMMQGGSGGGMGGLMQQLQSMAGQQQSINLQTQQMRAAAEAARLATEQEAVRKSLEQLNKEAQASGEGKRILGDLDQIAREMQEVIRNLEQSNVNPETIQKQERILSRLLDASKSMRERDYEKRRRGETGTRVTGRRPGELDPSTLEGQSRIREDLLKAMEQGYSKDYQELIVRYFEELQKIQSEKQ